MTEDFKDSVTIDGSLWRLGTLTDKLIDQCKLLALQIDPKIYLNVRSSKVQGIVIRIKSE